jgi:hypothetical protein
MLAALLLISVAPKSFFHDLIANHKDDFSCAHKNTTCLHELKKNCHFNDWVVNGPYWSAPECPYFPAIPTATVCCRCLEEDPFLSTISTTESRGPPAA